MNGIPSIQIQTTPAQLSAGKNRGDLSIDQYPSRASYNIKTIPDLVQEAAQRGHQTALETIGRITDDGNAVADQKATVAQLAVAAAQPAPAVVDLVSIERPNIDYTVSREPGTYEPGSVDIKV